MPSRTFQPILFIMPFLFAQAENEKTQLKKTCDHRLFHRPSSMSGISIIALLKNLADQSVRPADQLSHDRHRLL